MKDYKSLEVLLREGGYIVNNSPKHHLPLSYRNKLLGAIENEYIIGRISILCALKVYPLWTQFKPKESKVHKLLFMAEEYLEKKKNENELISETGRLQSYISDQNDEEHFAALYAGYSSVNAAYEVTGKNIEESDLGDFEIDSHDWDSAFWSNLAYNGGASGFDNINYNKSKEFWNWYLFEAIKIAYSNEKLVAPLDKKTITDSKEFIRSKTAKVDNDIEINSYIADIQNRLCNLISIDNWSEFEYIVNIVNDSRQSDLFCYTENRKDKIHIPHEIRHDVNNIVRKIKDKVYAINLEEGTFWTFNLIVYKDGSRNVIYLYDTRNEQIRKFFNENSILEDLKKYPRNKNFIPEWIK